MPSSLLPPAEVQGDQQSGKPGEVRELEIGPERVEDSAKHQERFRSLKRMVPG